MYSVAAWPPCHQYMTPVKATPMPIHAADSIAASFVVGACGLRWTISRSPISRALTNARNSTQIQGATSKLAKLPSFPDDESAARTAMDDGITLLPTSGCVPRGLPAEGLARRVGRAHRAAGGEGRPEAVLTMSHVEGYSPSDRAESNRRPAAARTRAADPAQAAAVARTMAWAAARRATGTRNGEQDT